MHHSKRFTVFKLKGQQPYNKFRVRRVFYIPVGAGCFGAVVIVDCGGCVSDCQGMLLYVSLCLV